MTNGNGNGTIKDRIIVGTVIAVVSLVGGGLGSLLSGGARELSSNSQRITILETQMIGQEPRLQRIESKLDRLIEKGRE